MATKMERLESYVMCNNNPHLNNQSAVTVADNDFGKTKKLHGTLLRGSNEGDVGLKSPHLTGIKKNTRRKYCQIRIAVRIRCQFCDLLTISKRASLFCHSLSTILLIVFKQLRLLLLCSFLITCITFTG